MKPIQDKFSDQASCYAQFRPRYPDELFDFLFGIVKRKDAAWDCGTGNGQVAGRLADRFRNVKATDISVAQLGHAIKKDNITYLHSRAEHTIFAGNTFDLITVGQAVHWFDFDAFYREVRRVGKPTGVLAIWGYGLTTISPLIDAVVREFYTNVIGQYWDAERRHIDEAYASVPFPFKQLKAPGFAMNVDWTVDQLTGYLNSWSAVQNYKKVRGENPVQLIQSDLKNLWREGEVKEVRFPLFIRVGGIGTPL